MGKGVRWFLKGLAVGYAGGTTYGFVIAADALDKLYKELERVFECDWSLSNEAFDRDENAQLAGMLGIKLERITGYGRRGDWAGLREYVELNLLAGERGGAGVSVHGANRLGGNAR